MRIDERLRQPKPMLSFEVFPPKAGVAPEPIFHAVEEIAALHPDYISVTYGAGGGTSRKTEEIAAKVTSMGVTALAHLTCVGAQKDEIRERLSSLRQAGIHNVLALRGDRPQDMTPEAEQQSDYHYAAELIRDVRASGDFCIGAACYPEGHVECGSRAEDLRHLKEKVDAGCDFLTTQMFFDNRVLYSFLYRLAEADIHVPVVAGVMPVTNGKQIARACALSGTSLPSRFRLIVDKYGNDPAAMKQAGIAYATVQIIDLYANGIHAVHVYAMNKPDVAAAIQQNVSEIIK